MDEVSQRLLSGIIQAPPKNLKRFDKMTKEERWALRTHRGEVVSGSINDYDPDDDEHGTIGNDGETIAHGVSGANMRRQARQNRNKVGITVDDGTNHPPCPAGFDKDKWAMMTLEEKLKHLGIDMKEWNKMNREQHMQRNHALANDFHFYQMDKVAEDPVFHAGRKKWHM